MENKKVEKEKSKVTPIGVLKIVGNVLFYAFIACMLVLSIMNINAGSRNGGFPNIFGKGFLSVQSGSMMPHEGTVLPTDYEEYELGQFNKGDLLYVDVFDVDDFNELKKGDVVTFFDKEIPGLNTHRIVYVNYDSDNNVSSIVIQGDMSAARDGVFKDPTDESNAQLNYNLQAGGHVITIAKSNASEIKGVVTGIKTGAGSVVDGMRDYWWIAMVVVGIMLVCEIFFVIKNFMELKGAKQEAMLAGNKEAMLAEIEAEKEKLALEKERLKQELLQELLAQQKAQSEEIVEEESGTEVLEEETKE